MTKVVLVTGASRGIGRVTALLLAQQGYAVGVNYLRDSAAAELVVAQIRQQGGKAMALQADIAEEAEVVAMFAELEATLGPIDALVNNAGILFQQASIEQLTAERINKVLTTNVTGYFLCCREAVKRMALRHGGQGGAIVKRVFRCVASGGSVGIYRLCGFKRGSGYVNYRSGVGSGGTGDTRQLYRVKSALPMQRGGQPEEVAQAIAWLLSDAASYVTGTFIEAAGGR
ncbi:hypothetical protein HA402_002268 [Bradysia odoriphaga]|nr:hypothetical protein HA402_002268 [Bradysia odoriphaga]